MEAIAGLAHGVRIDAGEALMQHRVVIVGRSGIGRDDGAIEVGRCDLDESVMQIADAVIVFARVSD